MLLSNPSEIDQLLLVQTVHSRLALARPLTKQRVIDAHLISQSSAEDALAEALRRHLRRSITEFAAQLQDAEFVPSRPQAAVQARQLAEQLSDLEAWGRDLREQAFGKMVAAFAAGATAELTLFERAVGDAAARERSPRIRIKQTTAEEIAGRLNIELPEGFTFGRTPEWMLREAFEGVAEVMQQDFWQALPEQTRDDIERVLREAIEGGQRIRTIVREIMDLGGEYTRTRAQRIAMTEVANMLNRGHASAIENLAEESGLPLTKVWLSVLMPTTRVSHAALEGEEVPAIGGLFNLDGFMIPYPAHPSLDAGNRVNCRCTLLSGVAAEALEADV